MLRLIIFIFLASPMLGLAQSDDHDSLTSDTLLAHYHVFGGDHLLHNGQIEFTADLNSFDNFDLLSDLVYTSSNGQLGAPYQILWFPAFADQLHPDYFAFFHRPDAYLFFKEEIKIFSDSTPFSVASYSSGGQRAQYFDFLHAQPLGKNWQMTLDYRLMNSPGAYKNQKNSLSNFYGIISHCSESGTYCFDAGMVLNRIDQQENGGLIYQNQFLDTLVYDRALTDVSLYSAQNRFRQNDYFISNKIGIGRTKSGQHSFYLSDIINLRREYHAYSDQFDPDSAFYLVWNAENTADSVNHYAFENTFRFGSNSHRRLKWYADFFISDDHVYNTGSKQRVSQKILSGALSWSFAKGFFVQMKAASEVLAFVDGERDFHFELLRDDSFKLRPYLRLSYCRVDPQIYYSSYAGNHFSWNREWLKTETLLGVAGLTYKGVALSTYFSQFSSYMFFNGVSFNQAGSGIAAGAQLTVKSSFGRFAVNGTVGAQTVRNAVYLSLPPWFAKAECLMNNRLFGRALSLQTGFRLMANAAYFADAYQPALQVFYAQQISKTGGFVYPTLFVRAQIKRAVVFAELLNATAGLMKVNYMQIPGYPLPDRGFRFGVMWSFLN